MGAVLFQWAEDRGYELELDERMRQYRFRKIGGDADVIWNCTDLPNIIKFIEEYGEKK